MRLAVLGDVHGNAFALRAVLDDIRAASPDQVLNLGDTVWGCADPASAWALQQDFAPPSVRGNTDERVAGLRDGKETMRAWLRAGLPSDVPATLAALPTHLDMADGEVRVAHGLTVVNAGPVSRQKDGLPLARWVQLTRRAGHWTAEFRRVLYDTQAAATWARAHCPEKQGAHEALWLSAGREP